MNVTERRHRIHETETALANLESWVAELEAFRRQMLASPPKADDYSLAAQRWRDGLEAVTNGCPRGATVELPGNVGMGLTRGKPGLVKARPQLENLRLQLDLLREELPSETELATAQAELDAVAREVGDLGAEISITWERFLARMADTAETAEEMARLRGVYNDRLNALHDHAREWNLDTTGIPRQRHSPMELNPPPPAGEQHLAMALDKVIDIVLHAGDPTPVLTLVEKARRAVKGEAVAA